MRLFRTTRILSKANMLIWRIRYAPSIQKSKLFLMPQAKCLTRKSTSFRKESIRLTRKSELRLMSARGFLSRSTRTCRTKCPSSATGLTLFSMRIMTLLTARNMTCSAKLMILTKNLILRLSATLRSLFRKKAILSREYPSSQAKSRLSLRRTGGFLSRSTRICRMQSLSSATSSISCSARTKRSLSRKIMSLIRRFPSSMTKLTACSRATMTLLSRKTAS